MTVLVAHASRHGATTEIAERIAVVLAGNGLDVTVRPAREVDAFDGVEALVLGASVYAGAWPRDAAAFVDRLVASAPGLPAWVFSSGPVGDPPRPTERPAPADTVADRLSPRDHAVFSGALDRSGLSLVERGIVAALRIPDGDYRDWAAIEAWAKAVGAAITAERPGSRPT